MVSYINRITMSGKKENKLSRRERKGIKRQKKVEKKLAKLEAKKTKVQKGKRVSTFRKHITALPFVGSKTITGFSGFLAAATFYQYEVMNDIKLTAIFGAATIVSSVLASAPYMKSVARTNRTLGEINAAMIRIDAFIGSQQQVVNQVVAQVEQIMQKKGLADVAQLKAQLDDLKRSVDQIRGATPQVASKVNVPEQKKPIRVG